LILVLAIGINFSAAKAIIIPLGQITINFSGIATGSLVGILLNAILPGKDFKFEEDKPNKTGIDLEISQGQSLVWQHAKKAG
jgi:uracil permease